MDVIPQLIDKLSLEDTVVHEFATLCLASLSVDFVCKVQIFDNNGLPPLIELLSSQDPDVKKNSLESIFNLVQDYQCRLAFHELGGIPPLLELLNSDFPVIQHLALEALQNVTTDEDTCNTFREDQGFEKLMEILNNKDLSDLHAEALRVLANCLRDSERVQLIHKDGGLKRLIDFLLTSNVSEIQTGAVQCITRVAQSYENRKLLHELNLEKTLIELMSVSEIGVKTATCQAVAAMSLHLASKDCFRDLGGIPAVVQGLSSESPKLREATTQALSNLTYNNHHNALAVYKAGGHEILIQLLRGSCSRTVANASATLGNMARQEVVRCRILSHGAIHALVEPLNSTDKWVLVNTTQCLAALVCDTEARAELLRAGGLHPLVNLLQSHDKDVLNNACLTINVCASDEATAVEMCKFGALELLQEINQSVNRRSSLSQLAMMSLLDFNLSVKYSLTGHLAFSDIINDGFYDAGKFPTGQRILTLEELSRQPVNQHRPIIVVNTASEETVDVPENKQSNPSEPDTSSKGDRRITEKKKDSDKEKEETQSESPTKKALKMMDDGLLRVLVKEAKNSILPLNDERERYAALARLVSEVMGGAVKMEKLHEFPWVLHLSELKFQLHSNIIPIGSIRRGFYCHRALLFKCLADCMGMSSTLVRGEYNRAWNEILVFSGNPSSHGHSSQPCRFIIDLMHQPGSLLGATTPAAVQYQTI
ncbi:armadillo repeat-containing protein 3 isoform X2 [Echeneis naucrates]|uniref:armadillo repeat-containing protein 3 isoform X2 n=1 Tax=Echeneis naucrates TaxID=173247 RepID=UPI001113A51F|nr:armadillo repeat-containing protein 3 isoform X2 [Echeneis naucrates]